MVFISVFQLMLIFLFQPSKVLHQSMRDLNFIVECLARIFKY